MAAQSDSQPTAQPPRRSRPWRAYVILGLVLIAVVSVLYARWAGRNAQALNAEYQAKIEWVTRYLGTTATADAERARSEILRQNRGSAQDVLRRVDEGLRALDRVALKGDQGAVSESRDALSRAQDALQQGEEADARDAIDDLVRALGPLTGE